MKIFPFSVRTMRSESAFSLRGTKTRMDTFKPAEPRWDARLTLPQLPWPPKSASYTVSGVLASYKYQQYIKTHFTSVFPFCPTFYHHYIYLTVIVTFRLNLNKQNKILHCYKLPTSI